MRIVRSCILSLVAVLCFAPSSARAAQPTVLSSGGFHGSLVMLEPGTFFEMKTWGDINIAAHLSTNGDPLADKLVRFTTLSGSLICTGVTDEYGNTFCSTQAMVAALPSYQFVATFAGDDVYAPSTSRGTIGHTTLSANEEFCAFLDRDWGTVGCSL